jgi:hypothetical protein
VLKFKNKFGRLRVKIQRMTVCASVDTVKRCAVCYFVNSEHCIIEFYLFQNVSSYEVGASHELGTSVLIYHTKFKFSLVVHLEKVL